MSIKIPNYPDLWESAVDGPAPSIWFGNEAPDGDAKPWMLAAAGSIYIQGGTLWVKATEASLDSDWSATGGGVVAQRVSYTDFTDGGGAIGTLTMDGTIPVGAYVQRVTVTDLTGFTGDSSAVMMVGDGTDDDRYTAAADINVYTTAAAIDGGAPQGTNVHVAAKTPVLTVTVATDWGAVVAGAFTIKIFYIR